MYSIEYILSSNDKPAHASNRDIAEYVKQQGMLEELQDGVPQIRVFLARKVRSDKK